MKPFRIVDRYLVREFLKPFLVALFILVIVLLSSFLFQLTDYIIIRQIPLAIVLQLLFYRLPRYIVQAMSMAVLFATLLALTRLVKDNELTALRLGGISFPRLVVPLIVIGLLISGLNYFFSQRLVPTANQHYQDLIETSIKDQEESGAETDILFKDNRDRFVYIGSLKPETGQLKNILIYDRSREENKFVAAASGSFSRRQLRLETGIRSQLQTDGYLADQLEFSGLTYQFQEELKQLYADHRQPSELSRRELKAKIRLKEEAGQSTTGLEVEYHLNLAEPLSCLIFVLLGAPLSIKSDKGRIFGIIASVIVIFIYYVFLSIGQSLGRNGLLSPGLSVWLPNILFSVIGVALIIQESLSS